MSTSFHKRWIRKNLTKETRYIYTNETTGAVIALQQREDELYASQGFEFTKKQYVYSSRAINNFCTEQQLRQESDGDF